MAYLLGCEDVHVEYPSKTVLDSVTLGVDEGDRIGIVGANGGGKSTLLAVLAGLIEPDSGRTSMRRGTTISVLGQMDTLDPESTVAQAVVGDRPEHEWASDARIRAIIGSLVDEFAWDARVGTLSGGQRRRVDLARVLVTDSDVLVLDEPTNHLDVGAITWLAEHLKTRWPRKSGALLVVTHDRWFLDEISTRMWEVHDGSVDQFEGGYSAYVLQRVERAEAAAVAEQKRQNLMRRELAWLSRGARARATKPKFHVEEARALIEQDPPLRNSVELKRAAFSRLGKQVIDLIDVTKRFGDKTVIDDVTWLIGPGDRFGIMGVNGSGKSTLVEIIRGAVPPTSGRVKIGKTVKIAYLSQHISELTQFGNRRVREVLAEYSSYYEIDGKQLSPAQLLEQLGFETAHLSAPVSDLSGGEKRRLQLMLILLDKPNVLILDEPDNDLDIDMMTALESLLDSWPGTLLMITHDRHLMERVTDDQFALVDGKITHMPGGVDEYLRLLKTRESASVTSPSAKGTAATAVADDGRHSLTRAEEYSLKKELASTERKLQTAMAKAEKANADLQATDPADYMALLDAQAKVEAAAGLVTELEDTWMNLSERLS